MRKSIRDVVLPDWQNTIVNLSPGHRLHSSVLAATAIEGGLVVADSVVALLRAVTPHAADCAKNTATLLIESVNTVRAVERLAHKASNYVEVLTNLSLRELERTK